MIIFCLIDSDGVIIKFLQFSFFKSSTYSSDGAPSQYKNKNNYVNMCSHKGDFDIGLKSYNFFCASRSGHGKSPYGSVGAVAKREVTRLVIRSPVGRQITNARQMYEAASENVKGIKFLWVGSNGIGAANKGLKKLYDDAVTVNHTRDYHRRNPVGDDSLEFKTISSDIYGEIVEIL